MRPWPAGRFPRTPNLSRRPTTDAFFEVHDRDGLQLVKTFHVGTHPGAASVDLSRRMSRAARRDTAPELALRRELYRRGRRYRVVFRVPGRNRRTIDVAFTRARLAVFVDGCFWHGCPDHGNLPQHNRAWWTTKLAANKGRDRDTDEHLAAEGWTVLRLWEHISATEGADRVEALLKGLERNHDGPAGGPGAITARPRPAARNAADGLPG